MKNNFPIQSPICGTYQELGDPIGVGDIIVKGYTLCFINNIPIQAETNGTITKIYPHENWDIVEQGECLFEIQPTPEA